MFKLCCSAWLAAKRSTQAMHAWLWRTPTWARGKELRGHRLVECDSESATDSAWAFTAVGLQRLQLSRLVCKPELVFKARPFEQLCLEDATPWGLLAALHRGGWKLKMCTNKRRLLPHTPGAALVWYTSTPNLSRIRKYMSALLKSRELFQAGTLQMLHHGQPVKYYDAVLKGTSDGMINARGAGAAAPLLDAAAAALAIDVDAPVPAFPDGLDAEMPALPALPYGDHGGVPRLMFALQVGMRSEVPYDSC